MTGVPRNGSCNIPFLCCFCLGATPSGAQCLLLALPEGSLLALEGPTPLTVHSTPDMTFSLPRKLCWENPSCPTANCSLSSAQHIGPLGGSSTLSSLEPSQRLTVLTQGVASAKTQLFGLPTTH